MSEWRPMVWSWTGDKSQEAVVGFAQKPDGSYFEGFLKADDWDKAKLEGVYFTSVGNWDILNSLVLGYNASNDLEARLAAVIRECDGLRILKANDVQDRPCGRCYNSGIAIEQFGRHRLCNCVAGHALGNLIEEGIRDIKAGRTRPWAEIKHDLDLSPKEG